MRRILLFICLLVGCVETTFADDALCMDGVLLFREDFGGNDPNDPMYYDGDAPGMSVNYTNTRGQYMGGGCYVITKKGYRNGIQWHRQDDHTYPNDTTRGYLLEVDGSGGNEFFYNKQIDGLCSGMELTFSAYVVNVTYAGQIPYLQKNFGYVYPRMKFVLKDPSTKITIAEKSTGDIKEDPRYSTAEEWAEAREKELSAEWQLVGMNFKVPEGVTSVLMYIYNDAPSGTGNDFALDDIEIHLCLPPVRVSGEHEVCEEFTDSLTVSMDDTPKTEEAMTFQWWFSPDNVTWEKVSGETYNSTLTFDPVQPENVGWYKVSMTTAGNHDSYYCRSMSEPFRLDTKWCCPAVPETHINLTVCDSLMPYTWSKYGYSLVFNEPGTQVTGPKSATIPECFDEKYIVTLKTKHCYRLYPLIVNKYNWQLLCDNVTLHRLFPERQAKGFQWYRVQGDEAEPIEGATEDNYSEHNELQGAFQLCVTMDDESEPVWSEVLSITKPQEAQPTSVRIYDSHGRPVREDQMTRGIYLLHYRQGAHVWIEKRLIL